MPLNRLLQIVTAALAAMGTMLLGMGQREVGMTLLMIMAAGLSVWLTDVKGWLYLNRNVANLIMLGAALFSLRDIFHIYSEIQALTFAQFLIYLQIILLFQKKDSRTYWLLIMLSLLQVVVAALFSQGVFFGILLVVYMVLASLALTLLMLSRQGESTLQSSGFFSFVRRPSQASAIPAASNHFRSGESDHIGSRWPLIDQPPTIDSVSAVGSRQGVSRELFHRILGMSARTLGLTMVLFVVVPRFGQVGWRGGFAQPKATVGFNDRVTLGETGKIIESPSEVMRIRFFDGDSDRIYTTRDEIYLYGAVLMRYENGGWNADRSAMSDTQLSRSKSLPRFFVREEITVESLDRPELFFIPPIIPIATNNEVVLDDNLLRLTRSEHRRKQTFTYHIGTTAFHNGQQLALNPVLVGENLNFKSSLQLPSKDGRYSLKKLEALAKQWIEESNLSLTDTLGRARFLEYKLARSGLFKYSMERQKRNLELDPIEDFLTERRAGHCEYFATALTLLLRSQNIHARMIVGFKCDEWNELGQCYQVRQLHAHTWVEAWIPPHQLPKEMLHGQDYWRWKNTGGWLRLDPTPARNNEEEKSVFTPIVKAMEWLDFTWSYYVVELNSERQRKAIFTPIATAVTKAFNTVRDPKAWQAFYERIGEALHRSGVAGAVAWLLLIVAIAASFALVGFLGYIFWRVSRKLWRILAAHHANRHLGPRIEVEFYRRLEQLLAKNGLSRPPGQTPCEFASLAGEWLVDRTGEPRWLALPAQVVDAYYHVRFGRLPLDGHRSQEVEHILRDLESQMANGKFQGRNGNSG